MHLAVLWLIGGCAGQDKSQGEVVAVVVADTHTDPGRDSVDEEVVPAVGREEGVLVSSFVPSLGSSCPNLGWVVEGERHESATAV